MAYLEEFRVQIAARNFKKITELWQEYCCGDQPDGAEICEILKLIKFSDFSNQFGQCITDILPLIEMLGNKDEKDFALSLIFDLQTTNDKKLRDVGIAFIKDRYENVPHYNEKLKLVGLRGGDESYQGAITNFMLLNHLQKGNFVLNTAGWGVGEVIEVSYLREQATIEFENLGGSNKDVTFKNAFKTLLVVPKSHFLARRFSDSDKLEKEAFDNPVEVVRMLLKDLGPKTASEIKDEFLDLVIPEKEYTKWWQNARTKLKKDSLIETPESIKEPYRLRKGHASWEERLEEALAGKISFQDQLSKSYNLVRDFPEILKDGIAKARLIERVQGLLLREKLSESELIQVLLFLENPLGVTVESETLKKKILSVRSVEEILDQIEIAPLKRRFLSSIKEVRKDWIDIYFKLLFIVEPNQIKDLLLKELSVPEYMERLEVHLKELLDHPKKNPEALVWYFQKVMANEAPCFSEEERKWEFLEALFILFGSLDSKPKYKDVSKKIYSILTANRFLLIRNFLKDSTIYQTEELLLLASKCHDLTDHDKKILRSLAEVAHPVLSRESSQPKLDLHVIWTTPEGHDKVRARIQDIATIEMIKVAKEIEAARALGDLRENAEYKAALERRSRLQSELKLLSDQFHKARVITKDDIDVDSVSIGTKVSISKGDGKKELYTILGPWDANPDLFILSFQSKFAQAMLGKKKGESFSFKGEDFHIGSVHSYLEG